MPHALRIMAPVTQVPLPNRLAMIFGPFIHPALRRVRIGILIWSWTGPSPEQILPLVRTFGRGLVLHVSDVVG
jgi:hypothetical protein